MSHPPHLNASDKRELLRIGRVYAREWLRSGRRPPGTPHRASLLAPSGAWLSIEVEGDVRSALRIEADQPVFVALAELAIELTTRPPALTAAQVTAARLEALAFGEARLLAAPTSIAPGAHAVAVVQGDRFALITASETGGWQAGMHALLDGSCRAAGLHPGAWHEPDARLYALDGTPFGD